MVPLTVVFAAGGANVVPLATGWVSLIPLPTGVVVVALPKDSVWFEAMVPFTMVTVLLATAEPWPEPVLLTAGGGDSRVLLPGRPLFVVLLPVPAVLLQGRPALAVPLQGRPVVVLLPPVVVVLLHGLPALAVLLHGRPVVAVLLPAVVVLLPVAVVALPGRLESLTQGALADSGSLGNEATMPGSAISFTGS